MSFCDIKYNTKDDNIISVLNKSGEVSKLYPLIKQDITDKNIYESNKDYFDSLYREGKLKSFDVDQLALGIYSIAYNSGKSEGYWINENKYKELYEDTNNVKYEFKAFDNVFKNISKVNQWFKQLNDTDKFWSKLQQDLQIPKEQLNLLRESEGNTVEEKLASFAANYSYTIEINTATDKTGHDYKIGTKTRYYSNLTVPGGTNYTENEIASPSIIPSIKGHAQFSTDNGIGWFRSDDSKKNEEDFYGYSEEYPEGFFIKATKTRRILEVQSDLFQKGRDKKDLILQQKEDNLYNVKKLNSNQEEYNIAKTKGNKVFLYNNTYYEYNGYYYDYSMYNDNYYKIEKNSKENTVENQFLQLLNKYNNWVTFFVKSIIQDSAKKGYEKILFPTGNTASKIEGHTTLEEFKKQKEDRIKELEKEIEYLDEYTDYSIDKQQNELKTLKQELERVDREGFGALKPIYKFYEENVTNILKKQGYNPVLITDEYGNTWNEIQVLDKYKDKIAFAKKQETKSNYLTDDFVQKLDNSPTQKRYFESQNAKSLIQELRSLDNIGLINSKVLDFIESQIDKNNVRVEALKPKDREEGLYAQFYFFNNTLYYNPSNLPVNNKDLVQLFNHELIHALTVAPIIRETLNKDGDMRKIINKIREEFKGYSDYGFKDEFEFVAEYLSNMKFKLAVNDAISKGTKKSFLDKLKEIIFKVLGISKQPTLENYIKNFIESTTEKDYYLNDKMYDSYEKIQQKAYSEDLEAIPDYLKTAAIQSPYSFKEDLLRKYGKKFKGNKSIIDPYADFGMLRQEINEYNKEQGSKVLILYQTPTGEWMLKTNNNAIAKIESKNKEDIIKQNKEEIHKESSSNFTEHITDLDFLDNEESEFVNDLFNKGLVESLKCQ